MNGAQMQNSKTGTIMERFCLARFTASDPYDEVVLRSRHGVEAIGKTAGCCQIKSAVWMTFKILLLLYIALPPITYAQATVCPFVQRNMVTAPVVLILQPQVHIWIDKGVYSTESPGAIDAARVGFQEVVARMFADEGNKVLPYSPVERDWEETPPNDNVIGALNDHFNSAVSSKAFNCPDLSKVSFKSDLARLGDLEKPADLAMLEGHDGFDLVIVSRASGEMKTKMGRTVNALAIPLGVGWESDALSFNIGVMDRTTGAILFYCSSHAGGDYLGQPDAQLSGPIRKCLDPYFYGKPKRRWFHWFHITH